MLLKVQVVDKDFVGDDFVDFLRLPLDSHYTDMTYNPGGQRFSMDSRTR